MEQELGLSSLERRGRIGEIFGRQSPQDLGVSVVGDGEGDESVWELVGEGSVEGRWGHSESGGPREDVLRWCLLKVTEASCPARGRRPLWV